MLRNSEVWHSVTKSQTDQLDVIDRIRLRYTLDEHSKSPIEWICLDTGKINLTSLIKIRRLMYLRHVLSTDESELGIDMSDKEIQFVSQEMFKKYVPK